MTRQASPLLLALLLPVAVAAVPSPASATAPHYRAQPVTLPAGDRLIVRDLVWKCGPSGCVTGKSNSRPATDCAALAREVGLLRSFSAGGRELSGAELEKCNARAR